MDSSTMQTGMFWVVLITGCVGSIAAAVVTIINAVRQPTTQDTAKIADAATKLQQKTDEQTAKIEQAAEAAKHAEANTNGNLETLRAQLESMTNAYITTLDSHHAKLLDALKAGPVAGTSAAGGRRAEDSERKPTP